MSDAPRSLSVAEAVRTYSRPESISDAVVHLVALVLAMGAVPVLITLTAVWDRGAPGIVGVSLYGATLIAMLAASLAYNHLPKPDWRNWLLRLDQSAIYVKIAGTYTPFAMLSSAGRGLLAAIWAAALIGSVTNFVMERRPSLLGVFICLGMGWAVLLGGRDLIAELSAPVLVLMIVGGGLYSLGTLFLLFRRMRFHNTIWHVFVVAASILFFVAIFMHAAQVA